MNKRQDRENESEGICGLRFNKWAERLYFHRLHGTQHTMESPQEEPHTCVERQEGSGVGASGSALKKSLEQRHRGSVEF